MKQLQEDLRELLDGLGLISAVPFGSTINQAINKIAPAEKERLQHIIERQQRFNNGILLVAVVMVGLVFVLGIAFAAYHRDNPTAVGVAFGGNLFSLLVTVGWIRKFWIEKGLLDLARIATEEMAPEEAIELAMTIYWRVLKHKSKPYESRRVFVRVGRVKPRPPWQVAEMSIAAAVAS